MIRGSSKKPPEKNASTVGMTITAVVPAASTHLRIARHPIRYAPSTHARLSAHFLHRFALVAIALLALAGSASAARLPTEAEGRATALAYAGLLDRGELLTRRGQGRTRRAAGAAPGASTKRTASHAWRRPRSAGPRRWRPAEAVPLARRVAGGEPENLEGWVVLYLGAAVTEDGGWRRARSRDRDLDPQLAERLSGTGPSRAPSVSSDEAGRGLHVTARPPAPQRNRSGRRDGRVRLRMVLQSAMRVCAPSSCVVEASRSRSWHTGCRAATSSGPAPSIDSARLSRDPLRPGFPRGPVSSAAFAAASGAWRVRPA